MHQIAMKAFIAHSSSLYQSTIWLRERRPFKASLQHSLYFYFKSIWKLKIPFWRSSTLEREPALSSGQAAQLWLRWVDPALGRFSNWSRRGLLASFQQLDKLPTPSAGSVLTP